MFVILCILLSHNSFNAIIQHSSFILHLKYIPSLFSLKEK